MKFSKSLLGSAAALVLAFAAMPASALDFTLDTTFTSGLTAPFGTVSLTQDGSDVDVTVALDANYQFVKTGGPHNSFTFNIAPGNTYTVIDITPGQYSDVMPGSNPAFGSFTDAIVCASCGNGGAGSFTSMLSFTVTGVMIDAFVANAAGFYFSADVLNIGTGMGGTTGAVGTGGPVPAVPEPETYALMLAGLGVVGFMARRRKPV